jgi:hypothetical protein
MALGKHQRTQSGTFRRERSDSLAKNLRQDYPEFENVHGNTRLGTLRDEYGVDSLNKVREVLRRKKQIVALGGETDSHAVQPAVKKHPPRRSLSASSTA